MESNVTLADRGLIVRADAIGSLEALAFELQAAGAPILRAAVGDVSRRDVRLAETAPAEQRAVLAFGVNVLPDARAAAPVSAAHQQTMYPPPQSLQQRLSALEGFQTHFRF